MKVLILMTVVTWSFAGGYQNSPSYQIVPSAESAAILIYKDQAAARILIEPDQKEWHLYEVDLKGGSIKEVPIPKISFIFK